MQNTNAKEIEKAKRLKLQEILFGESELDTLEGAKSGIITRNMLNKRQNVRRALVDDIPAKKKLLDTLKAEVEHDDEQ